LHKNCCFHKNHLTCNGCRKFWWIKYWKFQGKIITLSSFLSAPKKGYNLHTLGLQRTFAKKWWALKVFFCLFFFSWKC
jgi:hypothetical protein